jgi:thiamine biosynthesis lipoprotein ApbE
MRLPAQPPFSLPAFALAFLASLLALAPAAPTAAQTSNLPPAPATGIRPSSRPGPPRAEPAPVPVAAVPAALRRATTEAFDLALTIDVRDDSAQADVDAALRAAIAEVREIELLVDLDGDAQGHGVAALNAAAGGEAMAIDPRLADLLSRAITFCRWTGQAHGPLGGRLYALWGLHGVAAGARPSGLAHQQAVRSAGCGLLEVDVEAATARLAADSRIDLWGFAFGFAVDRAVEVLEAHGVGNAYVELGWVRRALGPGEDGRGWPALLPVFPGLDGPLDRLWLLDESLAVASAVHRPLILAGDRYAPYVDQRNGQPAEGVIGTVAATELAVDAEALAATMMVLGNREGTLRAGSLTPRPALLWLLGSGEGAPVVSQVNWTKRSLR